MLPGRVLRSRCSAVGADMIRSGHRRRGRWSVQGVGAGVPGAASPVAARRGRAPDQLGAPSKAVAIAVVIRTAARGRVCSGRNRTRSVGRGPLMAVLQRTARAGEPRARPARPGRSHERVRAVESDGGDPQARARAIAQRLGEVLGEQLAGELRRLSSGASRETFALRTSSGRALVAQIARDGDKLVSTPPQAALLRAAARAGVPVPAVVADGAGGADDAILGSGWTVVEALPGTTDPTAILAGDGVPLPQQLIDELAGALASIQRIPADTATVPPVDDP